jgi:hypothetical protein
MPPDSPESGAARSGLVEPDDFLYGDVNRDGSVTQEDAVLAYQFFVGREPLSASQQKAADVDGDGRVGPADVLLIEKKADGVIGTFPVEKEEEPEAMNELRKEASVLLARLAREEQATDPDTARGRVLSEAVTEAEAASRLVENEDTLGEAEGKIREARALFEKSKKKPATGEDGLSGSGSLVEGVDDLTVVLGVGIAASGVIALYRSS